MTKHRWTRLIALSVAVVALSLPSAAAAAQAEQILGSATAPVETSSASVPSVPSVGSGDSGFSWGDAALGAGAALAVVTIGAGGALMLRSARAERREVRPTS